MKDTHQIIADGLNYPLDVVIKRYSEEQSISLNAATEHALEAKRYLILCALNPEKIYAMRGPIDEFWHTFVTFTTLYFDFCRELCGQYIHHIPNTSPRPRTSYRINISAASNSQSISEGESMREQYAQMLADYEATFKVVPPIHFWPLPGLGDGIQPEWCSCACGVCSRECSGSV